MTLLEEMRQIDWWHSLSLPGLGTTSGREPHSRSRDEFMNIPWGALKGKSVLDVGAYDGLYSFQAEQNGAEPVVALEPDPTHQHGFRFAHQVLKSEVILCEEDGYSPYIPESPFDVVLCLGVLYHAESPFVLLKNLFGHLKAGGLLVLETAIVEGQYDRPILEFAEFGKEQDRSNIWYPNELAVTAMLRRIGYTSIVQQEGGIAHRRAWHARR